MIWTLSYPFRPWVLNAERTKHWSWRAQLVERWREDFGCLAKAAKIPALTSAEFTVQSSFAKGTLPDPVAEFPAFKAGLDGLIDVGVLPNDTGVYVRRVSFLPALRGPDSLTLTIEGEPA
jgi:crossover junction endodeoxyribonuclease RusA